MNNEEYDAQQEDDAADDDVRNTEKWILATQERCSRNNDPFASSKRFDWVVYKKEKKYGSVNIIGHEFIFETLTVVNNQCIVSSKESIIEAILCAIQFAVEFSKSGQSGSPHPNDQVFVLQTIVVRVAWIQFPNVLPPVLRLGKILVDYFIQGFKKL